MKNAIDIHELTVNYHKTSALWNLSVGIPKGELVGIIGPNGAGKSTLLKTLLGIQKALSGTILFFGRPLKSMGARISYVPQKREIDWDFPMTVFDVVLMGRYRHLRGLKWYQKEDKLAAKNILEHLEMSDLMERQISELSGGQQQRLFIARALLQKGDILLLDEPFAGVDQASEELIMRILKELRSEGKTILVVHHDLHTAPNYFDKVILLNTSLVAFGETSTVLSSENLMRAYGHRSELFEEALRLSGKQKAGLL